MPFGVIADREGGAFVRGCDCHFTNRCFIEMPDWESKNTASAHRHQRIALRADHHGHLPQ